MGRFKASLATINSQFGTLPLVAKMLFFALGVIVVMVLLQVVTQSARPTYVELLPGAAPDIQAGARTTLETYGIKHTAENGKVMVRPEDRHTALGLLGSEGKLPQNTQFMFATLLQQSNWMDSRSQGEYKQNLALQNELQMVISNFRGVERATVMMDVPEPMGLGMTYRKPTASVSVTMKSGKQLDRDMVDAIAAMVAGARAGLTITDVKVIDATTGRQLAARSAGDMRSGDYVEHVAKIEERVQAKLLDSLGYIRGVIVAVSAQADLTRRNSVTSRVLPVGEGSIRTPKRESATNTNDAQGGAGAEPGLASNTGADINRGGGTPGSRSTSEVTETEFQLVPGSMKEEVLDSRGMPTKVNVMISLPREYVVALVKQDKASSSAPATPGAPATPPAAGAAPLAASEPTQAEIEARFAAEKTRLERDLLPLITTLAQSSGATPAAGPTDQAVTVSMIPVPLGMGMIGAIGSGAASMVGGGGTGGGGEAGLMSQLMTPTAIRTGVLGAVILGAMGMMLMLVKKASKPLDLPTPQEIVGLPPSLEAQNDLVGEADEGAAAMVGIELQEDELKYKKMLEQVQEMVKKSPTDSAAILNRWVQAET